MSRAASVAAHRAWLLTLRPAARAFDRALRDPASAQRALLARLVDGNRDSAFGAAHGFATVRSITDFRAAVPIRTYDDLLPWIERAKRAEARVLTTAPVIMFECSSGSAGAAKFVPYTSVLLREFHRALAPWLCDVYDADPALAHGPAYWSVTPLGRSKTHTQGGVPIGVDADSDYLGPLSRWFSKRLLAVPRDLALSGDIDAALYLTLRFLLQHRSLALLSVWNPSLLTVLCRTLETRGDQLADDLRSGVVSGLDGLPPVARRRVSRRARRNIRQAEELRAMLREGTLRPLALWPRLRLISCWTSAEAKGVIADVTRLFPGVAIQGKGLLATEGVTTIPLRRFGGPVPAITSHFLEFVAADGGRVHLAHEVERGREYVPLLTTGGGLWRYRIGDRVRVTDVIDRIPVLEFVGRDDGVCDLRGEKLSPSFVSSVIDAMRASGVLAATFAMLTPANDRSGYVLFTDAAIADAGALDRLLRANPQYAYCRDLGQLRAAEVVHIQGDAHAQYLRHGERMNRRAGAVKLVSLDRRSGWADGFARRPEIGS
jgi:hypothetical protein